MLPKEDLYVPPMNIKVKDHRSFGRKPVVGFNIISSIINSVQNAQYPLPFIRSLSNISIL